MRFLPPGTWQYATIYSEMRVNGQDDVDDVDNDEDEDGDSVMRDESCVTNFISYRRLFLLLDEASLTFNADPELGNNFRLSVLWLPPM